MFAISQSFIKFQLLNSKGISSIDIASVYFHSIRKSYFLSHTLKFQIGISLFQVFIVDAIVSIVNHELFILSSGMTISISYLFQLEALDHNADFIFEFAKSTLSIEEAFSILFFNIFALSISKSLLVFLSFQYIYIENACFVSVSISVTIGVFASVGSIALLTSFLTSLSISFVSAQAFRVNNTEENHKDELSEIESIHFMSLISL